MLPHGTPVLVRIAFGAFLWLFFLMAARGGGHNASTGHTFTPRPVPVGTVIGTGVLAMAMVFLF